MVNEFIGLSPKSNDSRLEEEQDAEEDESAEAREFISQLGKYQVSSHPSDDETTSSSLVPLPDSLNKMRNELKRTINNIADFPVNPLLSSKFGTSLEELKKKYTMGKEAVVAAKINSVNTMLDDLLNKNEGKNRHQGSETSTTDESSFSSSTDRCKCRQFITHPVGANVCNFTQHSCFTHDSTCNYVNSSSPMREQKSVRTGKRRSFFEKIQDFQVKDKIQAVYRSMNKSKNRKKIKKEDKELLGYQGLPPPYEYPEITKRQFHADCDLCQPTYHKRVIVHPSDPHNIKFVYTACPSEKMKCTCSKPELKCTCPRPPIKCACPKKLTPCMCPQKFKNKESNCTCPNAEIKSTYTLKPTITCPAFVQTDPENIYEFREIQEFQKKPSRRKSDGSDGDKPDGYSWEPPLKSEKLTQTSEVKLKLTPEKIDVYYFDHGNSAYYRTTDNHPAKFTEYLIEKTDRYSNKFWAEIFGTVHVAFSFVISFILQLYRFIFTSLIRSLTVGLLQIFSDYFFKPLLTIFFNGIIQPILILAYNVATSLKDLCEPISQTCGFFTRELAHVFRACRFVEYNQDHCKNSSCTCRNKV